MNRFRLIIDTPLTGAQNMAKDHAILHGLSIEGSLPTLRLYRWEHASVTLGYFQNIEDCVNTSYCRKNGISITRRETGGGTVMHHMELTYSFTLPVSSGIVPVSVEDSFKAIILPIINSLRGFFLDAEYRPVNDVVIRNRKISGSAQVRRCGVLQQHGTLIMDMDNELISSVLIHDKNKLKKRGFVSTHDSVTSVRNEAGVLISEKLIEDFSLSLIEEFSRSFNIDYSKEDLTETENVIMKSYSKKFSSDEWNFKK